MWFHKKNVEEKVDENKVTQEDNNKLKENERYIYVVVDKDYNILEKDNKNFYDYKDEYEFLDGYSHFVDIDEYVKNLTDNTFLIKVIETIKQDTEWPNHTYGYIRLNQHPVLMTRKDIINEINIDHYKNELVYHVDYMNVKYLTLYYWIKSLKNNLTISNWEYLKSHNFDEYITIVNAIQLGLTESQINIIYENSTVKEQIKSGINYIQYEWFKYINKCLINDIKESEIKKFVSNYNFDKFGSNNLNYAFEGFYKNIKYIDIIYYLDKQLKMQKLGETSNSSNTIYNVINGRLQTVSIPNDDLVNQVILGLSQGLSQSDINVYFRPELKIEEVIQLRKCLVMTRIEEGKIPIEKLSEE